MHFNSKNKVRYEKHKVINQDSRKYLSIILSVDESSFQELRMIIEDDKVDLLYLPFIFELNENDLQYILQKSYYSDDSTLSLLFN